MPRKTLGTAPWIAIFPALAGALALLAALSLFGPAQARKPLVFAGGPIGGTFNYFVIAMTARITAATPELVIAPQGSGGSVANLRRLERGEIDFGIVYSGDAYLGRHGRLPGDAAHYERVLAVAALYGAPAHLVVRRGGGVASARDLAGRRVAVGSPGSGAATAARRFFTHLGLWDRIARVDLGYSEAARAFTEGSIDAFWVFAGFPNSSVIEAASTGQAELLDLHDEALQSGFYQAFPFYSPTTIPAGTYRGQRAAVGSFQDMALWCCGPGVGDRDVYEALGAVFSPEGLRALAPAGTVAEGLSVDNGLRGVAIPVAPGARRFWSEQGLDLPRLP